MSAHEHGTLQAAATHLHVSQSALTKSIQRLEETLGAPLFDRSGRRLVLNPLGQRMLRRAEALLRSADDLQREADLHMHAEIGEVVLGVGPVVALGRLPDVLTRYCAAHPTVRVVVRAGSTQSLVPRLMEGELHFVVADHELPSGNPALHARSLGPDPIGVAVRPGHPLRRRRKPSRCWSCGTIRARGGPGASAHPSMGTAGRRGGRGRGGPDLRQLRGPRHRGGADGHAGLRDPLRARALRAHRARPDVAVHLPEPGQRARRAVGARPPPGAGRVRADGRVRVRRRSNLVRARSAQQRTCRTADRPRCRSRDGTSACAVRTSRG
ncbi:MAG: LysR family transcriptional regulator [Sandaracinaceae bacterium]|nr:LysR family transcriptional regulator [Sandaracinaceae bacterium]